MSAIRILSLSLLVAAATNRAVPVPKPWQEVYAKISKTIVNNDVPAYMKWMHKDFVNLQDGKTMKFVAYQKMFTGFLKPFKNIKAAATPLTFVKKGSDVVITFHYTFSGNLTKDGKTRTVRFFADGIDTWAKSNGRFLERSEQITKEGVLPAKTS